MLYDARRHLRAAHRRQQMVLVSAAEIAAATAR